MQEYYDEDLAYVHAVGYGAFARSVGAHLVTLLQASPIGIRYVLDVGCGAGQTTKALLEAGFSVVAVEPSRALMALAQRAAPEAKFIHASIYEIALPPSDAILAVGEVLTYHEDLHGADDRVRAFFRAAYAALPPGGLLVFDVIATGEPSLSGRNWAAGGDWAVLVQVTESPSSRALVREIEIFRKQSTLYRRSHECHSVRLFDPTDLRAWLEDTGFEVEIGQSYGEYRLLPRRVAVIARRKVDGNG